MLTDFLRHSRCRFVLPKCVFPQLRQLFAARCSSIALVCRLKRISGILSLSSVDILLCGGYTVSGSISALWRFGRNLRGIFSMFRTVPVFPLDASDETPPGLLPVSGKGLAPSKEASIPPTDETSGDRELCSGLPPSEVGDSIICLHPCWGAIIPGAGCVGTAPCVAVPGLHFLQWG